MDRMRFDLEMLGVEARIRIRFVRTIRVRLCARLVWCSTNENDGITTSIGIHGVV